LHTHLNSVTVTQNRWNRPERGIWNLACGLPEQKARKKPLLMLRMYVDDSGKEDQSPHLVLAGYLSSTEKWAAFSNHWQAILDDAGIDSFRMVEAWRLARKFRKIGALGRDRLIVQLIECIKAYTERAFIVSMPHDRFYHQLDVMDNHMHPLGRPYFGCFYSLLASVYKYAFERKFDQRLEVIFDEQGGESQQYILSAMGEFRRLAGQDFTDLVIPTPTFQSDKDALPLQAADMLAWLVRRDALNAQRGVDRTKALESVLLGEALSMPYEKVIWDKAMITKASEDLAKRLNAVIAAAEAKSLPRQS
jgi:Protein of unknown function (DUF3800)